MLEHSNILAIIAKNQQRKITLVFKFALGYIIFVLVV